MNTAFLITGGNLGNRLQNLQVAKNLIKQNCGNIQSASSIYETAAWGFSEQPDFYNQALELHTNLNPENLISALLKIENEMGRKRDFKMAPRIIDIDILLFNNDVYESSSLVIPHPHIQERKFVLLPLAEIAGNKIHPVLNKTVNELLDECKDELAVHKISAHE